MVPKILKFNYKRERRRKPFTRKKDGTWKR